MSGFTCTSRAQCRLNGVFGTAVALCAACLAWTGFEVLTAGPLLWPALATLLGLWLVPLAPATLSVALWGALRVRGAQPRWLTTGLVCAGAVWAVVMLNGLERL